LLTGRCTRARPLFSFIKTAVDGSRLLLLQLHPRLPFPSLPYSSYRVSLNGLAKYLPRPGEDPMRDEGSERGVIRENHPPRGEDELAFVDGWTDGRMDGWTGGIDSLIR